MLSFLLLKMAKFERFGGFCVDCYYAAVTVFGMSEIMVKIRVYLNALIKKTEERKSL